MAKLNVGEPGESVALWARRRGVVKPFDQLSPGGGLGEAAGLIEGTLRCLERLAPRDLRQPPVEAGDDRLE